MKNYTLLTTAFLSLVIFFTSCSVEKRHYTKGYNVQWNKKAPKAEENALAKPVEAVDVEDVSSAKATIPVETKDNTVKGDDSAMPADIEEANLDNKTTATAKPYEYNANEMKKGKGLVDAYGKMMNSNKAGKIVASKINSVTRIDKTQMSVMSLLSFIFGILSLFAYYGVFVLAVLAIIFGAIAMSRGEGDIFATLGIVFGIVALVLWVLLLFVFVAFP